MRTTIPWGDGSGDNIYLDYDASAGNQTVQVSSDANQGVSQRQKNVTFSASGASPVILTVAQGGGTPPPGTGERYLRGCDKAKIDTGISQLTVGKFEVKFCPTNVKYYYSGSTPWQKICGGRSSHNVGNALSVYYNVDTQQVGVAIGGRFKDNAFSNILPNTWHTFVWDYSTGKATLDGVDDTTTYNAPTGNSYNFNLFGTGGQNQQEFPGGIAYCTIWDKNGDKVWEGTPYKNGTTVGMTDSISGNVFTASQGTLLRGIIPPSSGTYLYDYVMGDGEAYINTGLDVSGNPFSITGTFIRLRDATNEDTIISNFYTSPYNYWSVFIQASEGQKINIYTYASHLLEPNIPAIGQEVSLSLTWENGTYTLSALNSTVTASQANANPYPVRLLARGITSNQYPPSVMALKGEWVLSVNGSPARKLKPASQDGVGGMFDSVNGVFYPNAATLGFLVVDND